MWYKSRVGYQIYPRSFKGDDGPTGTIKGIISKLPYLSYLGVDLLWISPFYDSPMDDNGYDIRDYYKVYKDYGTIDDVKKLIEEAHKLDIKIIFDLVLNHTSDEHEWFKKSRLRDPYYDDFYIWTNSPCNWGAFFSGSAFAYDDIRGQYYMKIFSKKMPDLNWKSENLKKEMKKVIDFYLSLGIDGFRLDAISHIAKSPFEMLKPYNEIVYDWSKFSNLPYTHTVLKELNENVFSKHDIMTIGEIGGNATIKEALEYTNNQLDMVYTFAYTGLMDKHSKNTNINISRFKKIMNTQQTLLNESGWMGLYWTNHDFPRMMSIYGDLDYKIESASALALAMYMLRGTPFIYNGEEIGMLNYPFKHVSEFNDVKFKNGFLASNLSEEEYLKQECLYSRDHARTMMQWDDSDNAGFTTGIPWFWVNPNYEEINVKNQIGKRSILEEYRKIIKLKKELKELQIGYFENVDLHDYVVSYKRDNLMVISNFTKDEVSLDIPMGEILYNNYEELSDKLMPYQAILIRLEEN